MLLMKRQFLELIRQGKKRQTLRYWSYPRVKVGQRAYVPGLGYVVIKSVTKLAGLRALTAADAQADGFVSRRALLAELGKLYGGKGAGDKRWYRVHFSWPADKLRGRNISLISHKSLLSRRRLLRQYILEHQPARCRPKRR